RALRLLAADTARVRQPRPEADLRDLEVARPEPAVAHAATLPSLRSMTAIDPTLRIRLARLAVAALADRPAFSEPGLGLALIARDGDRALLGADPADPALELLALPGARPAPAGSTGLFHVAWLHPSRAALADTVRRIASARWPLTGASDHGVSEA